MEPASEIVKRELLGWPGVTVHDHRFGGIEFRVNGREMGHMHGDCLADLPFPKDVGKKLIAQRKRRRIISSRSRAGSAITSASRASTAR